ncbi:hypothetical protein PC129_g19630 [Phytophthora cactorum]|uniref:Uncharacterized protein n=1 Tax=Phytophthora cactorum TaxID=29920 RepID=A0A329SRS8_9STRA|nr:hypothetical protein Pcac1_g2115 [Phytophthora cactorum]KAG2800373.1 hypothetical protein PC111_g19995 [Phytophthora cactorum]KAG2810316.1 hypothetical protein PC112_g16117 [Phytophthora cactorum]KAG2851102.1 hypothetical protein PC113_g16201 [Phytophthora cactorum]KAG2879138.1 hypothetical protein PC114_g22728 [Phytophthora cactorum]
MVADRSSQWLRPLKSLVLEPVINLSGRRVALQQLKAIRLIRIQRMKTSTTVRYAVEAVQSCPQRDCVSRIPIATADCGTSTLQDGTYSQSRGVQIERELQEFITLRDKVYNIVRWAHRDRHCDFGGKVADLLVFGPNPDGPFLGLFGSKRASNTLQNFVTGILHLTVKCPSNANQCDCAGLSLVPEIAYSFLFDPAPFTNTHVELVDA